jgi:uncharacterized membrane protein (DUF2068 family)
MQTSASIRTVVVFEATKGLLVLLVGIGALSFTPLEIQLLFTQVIAHMHLNPAKHHPYVFIDYARQLDNTRMAMLAAVSLLYSTVRFVEAYGLWHNKRWAEWFAAVSGSIYLPFEIYELFNGGGWLTVLALLVNLLIVGLMVNELYKGRVG